MGAFIDGEDVKINYPTGDVLGDVNATPCSIAIKPAKIDTSFIAALKGKAAPSPSEAAAPVPTTAEASPDGGLNLPELPPLVAPRPVDEDALYPVSASIPVSEAHQELGRLRVQYAAMEEALKLANETITTMHADLGEANGRIGTLLLERTQGVESIIQTLRSYQAGGVKLTPVGSDLTDIFKNSTALMQMAATTQGYEMLETRLQAALSMFRASSNGAFNFSLESFERSDFWSMVSFNEFTLDKATPAKMIQVTMTPFGKSLDQADEKDIHVIIMLGNRIYHQSCAEIKNRAKKGDMFLNPKGTLGPGLFYKRGLSIAYNTSGGDREDFKFVADNLDQFIDQFCAQNLVGLLSSSDFNKALKGFKTLGLMP
ncbi:MAG TPA: hypothetical protein VIN59_01860 [Alphaproteobacteria bacterium]